MCKTIILQSPEKTGLKSKSSKVLSLGIWIFSFVCFSFYTADLTSQLTAAPKNEPVASFQEALDEGYTVIIIPGGFIESHLKTSRPGSGPYRVYHESILPNPEDSIVCSLKEAVERLLADQRALWFGTTTGVTNYKGITLLTKMKDRVLSQLAFGLRKDSEFKSMFDHHLMKIIESGMLRKHVRKWLEGGRPEFEGSLFVDEAKPLGLDNLLFPCTVLGLGIGMGLILSSCFEFSLVSSFKSQLVIFFTLINRPIA